MENRLTDEQRRQRHSEYQKEWQRKKRARLKSANHPSGGFQRPSKETIDKLCAVWDAVFTSDPYA